MVRSMRSEVATSAGFIRALLPRVPRRVIHGASAGPRRRRARAILGGVPMLLGRPALTASLVIAIAGSARAQTPAPVDPKPRPVPVRPGAPPPSNEPTPYPVPLPQDPKPTPSQPAPTQP